MEWVSKAGLHWLEATLPGARAVFTTRRGGVSEGGFEGLNLAVHSGDEPSAVTENRRLLAGALGLGPDSVRLARQVHGSDIRSNGAADLVPSFYEVGAELPEADGHVTADPGLALAVLVADCLPVALAGGGGVAILHCGWRGLADGIIGKGAALVEARAAAIGPGIGVASYEVGDEVLAAFEHLGEEVSDGARLDLAAVAVAQLREAGVEQIETSGIDTATEPELYSHRRDGPETGRQAGLVWIE